MVDKTKVRPPALIIPAKVYTVNSADDMVSIIIFLVCHLGTCCGFMLIYFENVRKTKAEEIRRNSSKVAPVDRKNSIGSTSEHYSWQPQSQQPQSQQPQERHAQEEKTRTVEPIKAVPMCPPPKRESPMAENTLGVRRHLRSQPPILPTFRQSTLGFVYSLVAAV